MKEVLRNTSPGGPTPEIKLSPLIEFRHVHIHFAHMQHTSLRTARNNWKANGSDLLSGIQAGRNPYYQVTESQVKKVIL